MQEKTTRARARPQGATMDEVTFQWDVALEPRPSEWRETDLVVQSMGVESGPGEVGRMRVHPDMFVAVARIKCFRSSSVG